jgi:hypothetical protein
MKEYERKVMTRNALEKERTSVENTRTQIQMSPLFSSGAGGACIDELV